ncbi:MAG: hypothetical protein AVDCRST_MAG08-2779, partial [uncultured Acetobacteraceae bacterium]
RGLASPTFGSRASSACSAGAACRRRRATSGRPRRARRWPNRPSSSASGRPACWLAAPRQPPSRLRSRSTEHAGRRWPVSSGSDHRAI